MSDLYRAANVGDLSRVKRLVQGGVDVNWKNKYWFGSTSMHKAAAMGRTAVVAYLAETKANIEATDNRGYTPMHEAAMHGKTSVVTYLAETKANIDAKTNKGETPLDFAYHCGQRDIMNFLQEKGKERIKRHLERDLPCDLRMLHLNILNAVTTQDYK
eukprot:CAMPEP_0167757550 /NCGR_PEP_ID=MMETSP0110_2-20121227/9985_1 /TAXON_ID=629695 /ORGANISM="Gymnochlora sp., Strain CCMP2014" /LENGTH=157 /DNA_ID=CAMNT_0007643747 /DNA_START=76 /DNA_END=549 /DNA_ORIENTATION=-